MPAISYEDEDATSSLDLECVLVSQGVRSPREVCDAVADRARLEPPENSYGCNCFILPGELSCACTPGSLRNPTCRGSTRQTAYRCDGGALVQRD